MAVQNFERILETDPRTASLPKDDRKEIAQRLDDSIPNSPVYMAIVIGIVAIMILCLLLIGWHLYKNPSSETALTGVISFVTLGIGALVGTLAPRKAS